MAAADAVEQNPVSCCRTEKAHDSRGMDVMGTLDLSIQGWFINPDDIVRMLTPYSASIAAWLLE